MSNDAKEMTPLERAQQIKAKYDKAKYDECRWFFDDDDQYILSCEVLRLTAEVEDARVMGIPSNPGWTDNNVIDALGRVAERCERYRLALVKVCYKAGSHTVGAGTCLESDPGFGGIFAVADNALKAKEKSGG